MKETKKIKRETLDKLIKVSIKYWKTGDGDLLHAKNNHCETLEKQSGVNWLIFSDILCALTSAKVHEKMDVTKNTIYKVFELIGFEIRDKIETDAIA